MEEEKDTIEIHKPIKIFDLGSGPEMLRRHISEHLVDKVVSVDINPAHFKNAEGKYIEASFAQLPFEDKIADYVNMSLGFHYTAWQPKQGEYERLKVLAEMNRILKPDGKAIISLPYSMDLRDVQGFTDAVSRLGFEIVEQYSGIASHETSFNTRIVSLKKVHDSPVKLRSLVAEVSEGLRLMQRKVRLRDSRKIATSYSFDNGTLLPAHFNALGQAVLDEEQATLRRMQALKSLAPTGTIRDIPAETILKEGFARIFNSKKYLLYKMLERGDGAVILHD